jgi:hypothetical protein
VILVDTLSSQVDYTPPLLLAGLILAFPRINQLSVRNLADEK